MKVLVAYDSQYGNTEQIARAIGGAISGEVKVLRVGEVNASEINAYDLFIAGCPTQGGRHTVAMRELLDRIPAGGLKNIKTAAFDTRLANKLLKIFGYAAGKIDGGLKEKGGSSLVPAEGFFVKATKGPLADGELERAAVWGKTIISGIK